MKISKSKLLNKILYAIVRLQTMGLLIYAIFGLISDFRNREESEYVFIVIQCVLLFVLTFVPGFVHKVAKVELPIVIEIFFLLFTTAAIMFGEIFSFYIKYSWWDDVLHTFSGSFIAVIGFVILYYLNERKRIQFSLSPFFIVFFCFCFSLACEAVWEVIEYTADGLTGSNMQRYMDNIDNSIKFMGRDALADTMSDIIETIIGAFIVCVLAYLDMIFRKKSRLKKALLASSTEGRDIVNE